jgi:hypothetical protein
MASNFMTSLLEMACGVATVVAARLWSVFFPPLMVARRAGSRSERPLSARSYSGPRAMGRDGSELHSDHEPGNSAASQPTAASAASVTVALTPEPQ